MADFVPGRVRRAREELLGLTQRDLAAALGVTEHTVANWESGRVTSIRYANLVRLSELSGKPVGWFRP